jgi:geranylgeranyl pyrophosphate synthase
MLADFESQVPSYQARVNDALAGWLQYPEQTPSQLLAAMRYAVLGPGKRIRPLLCYATAQLLELDPPKVDPIAVAIEFVHAYSLIHDDLPSMDDDDLRRGRPTTHRAFDEATAILAGDALQALAFQVLIDDPVLKAECPEHQATLVGILARAAGPAGMVGGQILDLGAEGHQLNTTELEDLHQRKTGRLIEAAVMMPAALCPDRDDRDGALLQSFASSIGLAFQIRDDILEVEEDTATLGKSADSDADNAKSTYPSVLGLAQAKHRAEELYQQAESALDDLGANGVGLRWLCEYIVQRHH